MRKGFAAYVLMSFDNFIYLTIEDGDLFGHIDLVIHKRALELQLNRKLNETLELNESFPKEEEKIKERLDLKRIFSIQSLVNSELVMLPINHLLEMKKEFPKEWLEMMTNAY